MRKEVLELQKKMFEEGMDIYYIPYSDFHASEYMHPYFKCREFISGFDGSYGDMLVTSDDAYLWTDGRYFLQAEDQLKDSGITLMKEKAEGVPTIKDFICEMAEKSLSESEDNCFILGLDGRVTNADFMLELEDAFIEIMENYDDNEDGYGRIRIKTDEDLVGSIWNERPEIVPGKLYELPLSSVGKSFEGKLSDIRASMEDEKVDYLLLCELSEIAWLFNLRGSDVEYSPVFYAFSLISKDEISIYLMDGALEENIFSVLQGVNIKTYESIYADVAALPDGSVLWMDPKFANYELYSDAMYISKVYLAKTPASQAKQVKNEIEVKSARQAHIKDGVAVTKFIKWIKDELAAGHEHSEISVSDYLESLRAEQDGFIELSFPTIAAYGANGAIVHYNATPRSNAKIKPEGFLLVDSGGQYIDGTTDITRTIAMGALSQEMIDDYTYVLKSHIAYARMRYEEGMKGITLEKMLKKPLVGAGIDFNHGISHGVGHVLCVHEEAAVIRDTNKQDAGIKAGMIMSDEPGFYKAGEFGIRIENLVIFEDDGMGGIINEPLTRVPYEREAINKELLSGDEIQWINDYHASVCEVLTPLLDDDTAKWLSKVTAPI